jgi:glycosidase
MPMGSEVRSGCPVRQHPHLMEINVWTWLDELSRQAGRTITLGRVPAEEWDRLKALGFDLVWLMGIWTRSAAGRAMFRTDLSHFEEFDRALPGWRLADVVGSPYSIQGYVPDPHLGDWDQIDWVRKQLNQRGIGLILDFVPNHTGPDHAWVQTHPEYYVQASEADFRRDPRSFIVVDRDPGSCVIARGKDPYFPAWPDTAQLNYFNPDARAAMAETARTIAQHADGMRCDMAMLVLNEIFARTWQTHLSAFQSPKDEFWPDLIASLPELVWIAEVYWDMEWRLQQMGFKFTYDKRLYDRLRSGGAQDVVAHLRADVAYQSRLARFLENHDEQRSAALFTNGKLPAGATLVATLPGLRFYHHGQMEGWKRHLPIALRRAAEEGTDAALQAFYEKLLAISNRAIFHEGNWTLLDVHPAGDDTSRDLLGYSWSREGAVALVAVNLSPRAAQGRIFPGLNIDHGGTYRLADQIHGSVSEHFGQELVENGVYVRLEGYGCRVFEIKSV